MKIDAYTEKENIKKCYMQIELLLKGMSFYHYNKRKEFEYDETNLVEKEDLKLSIRQKLISRLGEISDCLKVQKLPDFIVKGTNEAPLDIEATRIAKPAPENSNSKNDQSKNLCTECSGSMSPIKKLANPLKELIKNSIFVTTSPTKTHDTNIAQKSNGFEKMKKS